MNVFEYEYEKKGKKHRRRFRWINSLELTEKNLVEMIDAARGRWKTENESCKYDRVLAFPSCM